jgi:hypothetical protein
VDLVGDRTGARCHVQVAVAQRQLVTECVLVVPVHVAEPSFALMTDATIELDDQAEPLVLDVALVRKIGPRTLALTSRQAMSALHVLEVAQLEVGANTLLDLGQQAGDESTVALPRALFEQPAQLGRCREPLLDGRREQPQVPPE